MENNEYIQIGENEKDIIKIEENKNEENIPLNFTITKKIINKLEKLQQYNPPYIYIFSKYGIIIFNKNLKVMDRKFFIEKQIHNITTKINLFEYYDILFFQHFVKRNPIYKDLSLYDDLKQQLSKEDKELLLQNNDKILEYDINPYSNAIINFIPILNIGLRINVNESFMTTKSNYNESNLNQSYSFKGLEDFPLNYIKRYLLYCVSFGNIRILSIYLNNKNDLKEKDLLNDIGIRFILIYIKKLLYNKDIQITLKNNIFENNDFENEEFLIRKRFNDLYNYYYKEEAIYNDIKFKKYKKIFLDFYDLIIQHLNKKNSKYDEDNELLIPSQFYFSIDYLSRTIYCDVDNFDFSNKLYNLLKLQLYPIDLLIVYFCAICNIIVKDDILLIQRKELAKKIIDGFHQILNIKYVIYDILEIPIIQRQLLKVFTFQMKIIHNDRRQILKYHQKFVSILTSITDKFPILEKQSLYMYITEAVKELIYIKEYKEALQLIKRYNFYLTNDIKLLKYYKLICEYYLGKITSNKFKKELEIDFKFQTKLTEKNKKEENKKIKKKIK